jgi:hypothetical protein
MELPDTNFGDLYTASDRKYGRKNREDVKAFLGLIALIITIAFIIAFQFQTFLKSYHRVKTYEAGHIVYKVI